MQDDFAENYSLKKWFASLDVSKKRIKVTSLSILFGGMAFVGTDWLADKFNTKNETKYVQDFNNIAASFLKGAMIASWIVIFTNKEDNRSESGGSGQ
ncbi:MAG: hypothetical protein ACPGJU_11350 [Coraliomargarita sp.]